MIFLTCLYTHDLVYFYALISVNFTELEHTIPQMET